MIKIILALDSKGGLGVDGELAWDIPEDLKNFKKITSGKTVAMGRKTWDSLPFKPLPNRSNVVFTRSGQNIKGAVKIDDIKTFVEFCGHMDVFIIGGAEIYKYFLEKNLVSEVYLTRVNGDFECDTFLDYDFKKNFELEESSEWKVSQKSVVMYKYEKYVLPKKTKREKQVFVEKKGKKNTYFFSNGSNATGNFGDGGVTIHHSKGKITVGEGSSIKDSFNCGDILYDNTTPKYPSGVKGRKMVGNNNDYDFMEDCEIIGNNTDIEKAINCKVIGNNVDIQYAENCEVIGNNNDIYSGYGNTMTGNNNNNTLTGKYKFENT